MPDPVGSALVESLIAENFSREGGVLRLGGLSLETLAQEHGTPLFVYDAGLMRRNYRALAASVSGFAQVVYSVKANPNPVVIRVFREEGAGAEIASAGEYEAARAAGIKPGDILFAGPGKSEADLAYVVAGGIGEIHLENAEEIARLAAVAEDLGVHVRVALRINPGPGAQGGAIRMGGKPAPFGFDEEELDPAIAAVEAQPRLRLAGVHMFAGTQGLAADTLLTQWRYALGLAARVAARIGRRLETIDLGGGLGIPYFAGETPVDLAAIRAGIPALAFELRGQPLLAGARVVLEPGRHLVGPAGVYVARVLGVKRSRGSRFVITDGGMHHHLAASGNLGQVVKRDFPLAAVCEPPGAARTPCAVVGPLCTPLDMLARATPLPELSAGDLIAVLQSGAYALTASPTGFLSHPLPAELLVEQGKAQAIRGCGV